MEPSRWLLPFTFGVDMQAIDSVVQLAESGEVTLVAASLISTPQEPRSRGVRLEHIQQSKDFLEAVKWKAARYGVPAELHEVYTVDAMQSITTLIHELRCDGMVLVSRKDDEVLLHASQFKRLLESPPATLVLIRLSEQPGRTRSLSGRFLSWLKRLWGQKDDVRPVQDMPAIEEPLWIRMEEHHPG
jgi:hypothetical protein